MVQAITFRSGNCERAFIMLSVIPSLRYSMLGSALVFASGRIASEVMPFREGRWRDGTFARDNDAAPYEEELKASAGFESWVKPILRSKVVNRSSARRRSNTGSDLSQISHPSRSS